MTQLLGLNSASRYIPKMLSCTRNLLDSLPEQKPIDLLQEMTELVFNIFNEVLFGKDVTELVTKLYPYENSDGTTEEVTLREILIRLSRCYIVQHLSPLTSIMLYFGADTLYYLNPYKRDKKNLETFKGAIRSIVSTSKETNSIGNKLYDFSDATEEEKVRLTFHKVSYIPKLAHFTIDLRFVSNNGWRLRDFLPFLSLLSVFP